MFVDAILAKEYIYVVERIDGVRTYKEYPADYHFFVNDPAGEHKTIYGNMVTKLTPSNSKDKKNMVAQFRQDQTWETDINPIMRCLEQEYRGKQNPKLNIAFFDIETDFDEEFGYSHPSEARNRILSVSVYLQWMDRMVCLAVPPPTISWEEAEKICDEVGETILFHSEKEMLETFLTLIEDADVLSGWNSEFFDIPYTVNRVIHVLGKSETRRFCLWNKMPDKKSIERGGKEESTYSLFGRISLDYMQLYKKYNYEERQSYSLNAIAEAELGETKVPYDGTLDHLYKHDFKLFLEYNIQDTRLLDKLDRQLQYVDLASSIAHDSCVLIPSVMGAVVTTEQSVVCEAHALGLVVPNKKRHPEGTDNRAAGGWVSCQKKGLHKWIGSSDLNSLYPSVIRALNMSNETIVGQIRIHETDQTIADYERKGASYTFAKWWNDRFSVLEMEKFFENDTSHKLYLDMEDGNKYVITGAELRELIFNSDRGWCISANGTIFRTDIKGVIPSLLERWYNERKQMQGIMRGYKNLVVDDKNEGIPIPANMFGDNDVDSSVLALDPFGVDTAFSNKVLTDLLKAGDRASVVSYINAHRLHVKNGKLVAIDAAFNRECISYWDKRQLVRKINLNSVYGGLLNEHHRFFDKRLGQSTTLTGRCITKHMTAETNKILTGDYDHAGICTLYNDTDSCYFTAYPALKKQIDSGAMDWSKETVIALYDEISETVSDTFPEFMNATFNVPFENGKVIKSGREVIAETGLFIKKKRYALLVFDNEGKRQDVGGKRGKIKVTGLDLRRSDTPKFVQEFLMGILTNVLYGKTEDSVITEIREFKEKFGKMKPWEKGVPKAVNNITSYMIREEAVLAKKLGGEETKGFTVPGHVRGAINWNLLRSINRDNHSTKILDGSKIVLCYVQETESNKITNIAYPVDELHLPEWFLSLPFDEARMEETIVDNKLENLLSVLKWDLKRTGKDAIHMESLFDFSAM
jgi:DNA polymerase elongation subunit (family B)